MVRKKPVCKYCGSDNVLGDAYVVWDEEAQRWGIAGEEPFDKPWICDNCGGETSIIWVRSADMEEIKGA